MKQMKLQELEKKREKIALDEQDDLWEQEAAGRPNFTDTYMGLERIDISRSPLVIGRSREVVRQGDRVEPTGTCSRRGPGRRSEDGVMFARQRQEPEDERPEGFAKEGPAEEGPANEGPQGVVEEGLQGEAEQRPERVAINRSGWVAINGPEIAAEGGEMRIGLSHIWSQF